MNAIKKLEEGDSKWFDTSNYNILLKPVEKRDEFLIPKWFRYSDMAVRILFVIIIAYNILFVTMPHWKLFAFMSAAVSVVTIYVFVRPRIVNRFVKITKDSLRVEDVE